ncbi:MAG TPA: glucose 1-dehydrogenase [Mycobacterium sp.]|nr:glucose 1-dehydrogenase [Mycobacterium sp.]HTX98174.1 glucose 1-dehydrogenase [Mycobacterium sp.]
MTLALEGKVAVVTGSGKGLGATIARRFATDGARVVVSDIDHEAAKATAHAIDGAIAIPADVTDERQIQALVASTVEELGGLHIMVANAGVGTPQPILQTSLADWRRTTSVNLDGVFMSIRYAAPAIIASGGGSIITMSSITSTTGSPLMAAYAAAKAAVCNLTQTAAIELRPFGVRVNALLPGFSDTALVTVAMPTFEAAVGLPAGGFDELIAQKQGRYVSPDEVAAAAAFFASEESGFCTGSSLVIDGGFVSSLF